MDNEYSGWHVGSHLKLEPKWNPDFLATVDVPLYILIVRKQMKQILFIQLLVLIIGCQSRIEDKPRSIFGNVFRIDSVAGRDGLSDPFFIVLTKDSLFNAYGYWDYSFPYETELRVNSKLEVLRPGGTWKIEGDRDRIWLTTDSVRLHYSIAPGTYDSAFRHLRVVKTQESLLLGQWELQRDKTEADNILRCKFSGKSLLRFARVKNKYKIVQLINIEKNGADTCLLRGYRLNGSEIMINDEDTWPPYKIIRLDRETLIIQDWKRLLYFKKVG